MEDVEFNSDKLGLILAVIGILSIVLSIFNYNLRLLAWVDLWGITIGWIIRILLIIGGGALFFFFGEDEE